MTSGNATPRRWSLCSKPTPLKKQALLQHNTTQHTTPHHTTPHHITAHHHATHHHTSHRHTTPCQPTAPSLQPPTHRNPPLPSLPPQAASPLDPGYPTPLCPIPQAADLWTVTSSSLVFQTVRHSTAGVLHWLWSGAASIVCLPPTTY